MCVVAFLPSEVVTMMTDMWMIDTKAVTIAGDCGGCRVVGVGWWVTWCRVVGVGWVTWCRVVGAGW